MKLNKAQTSKLLSTLFVLLIIFGAHGAVLAQNNYQISRTWGPNTNDWAEIGSFPNTQASQYVVFTVQGHWCGSIISAQFRYDDIAYTGSSTNWLELAASNGGKVYNATQPVAIDVKRAAPGSQTDPILARIRNLHSMCSNGVTSLNISIETNTTFTAGTDSGSSGTVDAGYAASNLGWKFPVTTDGHAASSDGLFVLNTGNVGIGTIVPNQRLDLVGKARTRISGNDNGGILIGATASEQPVVEFRVSDDSVRAKVELNSINTASERLGLFIRDGAANWNESLSIVKPGNVGLGTATPNAGSKLDVRGGVSINQAQSSVQRGNGLDLGWTGSGNADLYLGDYTNGWALGEYGDASLRIFKTSGAALSSTPLTIQSGGNVGIGTTNPTARLSINGGTSDINIGGYVAGGGYNGIWLNGGTAAANYNFLSRALDGHLLINRPGGSDIYFSENNASNDITIKSGGNVGIGTTDPAGYRLNVNGAINATGLNINGSPVTSPWSAGSGSINYTSGNVGIGTGTPNAGSKLDVRGGGVSINQAQSSTQRGAGLDLGWTGNGNADLYLGDYTNGWALGESGDASLRIFKTSGAALSSTPLTIQAGGNVGIGTTSPSTALQVNADGGGVALRKKTDANGNLHYDFMDYSGNDVGYLGYGGSTWNFVLANLKDSDMYFYNDGDVRMSIQKDTGNVGIGTTSPSYKLDVNGTINSNSTITGNNIVAKYQDVAEWVPSSERLAAGTVVVLDSTKTNQVISSSQSYDTRVAGVISAQPGITLGEKGDSKVLVATTGRVKVKVDASKGPIHIGDLLVTSDVPGVAMKSEPVEFAGRKMHMPGTLIGKALEPLEKGSGEILVLLSLQ